MPRKGPAPKRPPITDPVYASPLVTQLVNKVLMSGKRSLAERIVYGAMEGCREKSGTDPVITLKRALDNVKPTLEVKSRRVGGATYQVPMEVRASRGTTLALRWLVQYSRARREKTMTERLMNELLDASNGLGASVKRREDTHKMAESNKAFAHYRWSFETPPFRTKHPEPLPSVMRERFVRFRHAMRVFALLHGAAAQICGVEQLVGQLLFHRLAVAARPRVADEPADAERQAAVRVHFDRHLVVRSADAPRFHLEAGLHIVDGFLEGLQRIVAGLLFDDVEAAVENPFRRAALAAAHHRVDEAGNQRAAVKRVGGNFSFCNNSSSRHFLVLYF
jgi:small subunit ribosomal protein S7